jgi:glycosyltransferase involved in cell wall biosynthesis
MAGASQPPVFPPRPPADGRVSYAFLSQGAYLGGAEVHISRILDYCDPARVRCDRIAIKGDPEIVTIPNLLGDWEEHAPVRSGERAIREAVVGVDVVLTWGFESHWLAPLIPPGVPVVEIAHSAWEWAQPMHAMPRSTVVVVSAAALASVPPDRREGARIILNAVHPDRVRVIVGRAEQRARWAVPDGLKVAGVVSRLSIEKDPTTWIDGIAALPVDWVGVWVGTGTDDDQFKSYADRVAPGRVLFPGPTHDVGSALGAFDTFVMTSGSEGCCYALAEAWLAGVPSISKPVGFLSGHRHLSRLLPPDATGQDVAEAILADGRDPVGTSSRVDTALAFATAELSMDKFGREWTDLICSLAPNPVKSPSLARKAVTFGLAVTRHVADGARKASTEEQDRRKAACEACSHLNGDNCRLCGCHLNLKRSWASESCPDNPPRWEAEP